jgi:hypothetical protein
VGARDANAVQTLHERSEELAAAQDRDARCPGGNDFRILFRHGGRHQDDVRARDVACLVTARDRRAALRQLSGCLIRTLIRTTDGETHLQQQRGDGRQPGPADTDEVDANITALAGRAAQLHGPGRDGSFTTGRSDGVLVHLKP